MLPEPLAGEGLGLAHQGANDVVVVDPGFPLASHPFHPFHEGTLVVHFDTVGLQSAYSRIYTSFPLRQEGTV